MKAQEEDGDGMIDPWHIASECACTLSAGDLKGQYLLLFREGGEGVPYLWHIINFLDVGGPANIHGLQLPTLRWGLILGWGWGGTCCG